MATNEDAKRALALLSASPQITPLSLRLDAAALLSRIIEDHRHSIRFLDDDRALTEPLLAALVPAFLELDAHDEELEGALVALLTSLLRASCHATEQLFVQLEIVMGGSGGVQAAHGLPWAPPCVSFTLLSLIGLAFDVDLHAAAATLPKCRHLVRTLARGVDAVAETRAHPHASDLATFSLNIFLKLLQACDEPASLVLAACSLSPNLFIGLLPGVARGSRPSPSGELLELLHEIAADPTIAPLLATPAVLAALKPQLLSSYAPLQLACIEVLSMLHDHDHGDAIAAEDIGAFLIEMIRRQARLPASAMASAAEGELGQELGLSVRTLLRALLSTPRPSQATLCGRLLDALLSSSGGGGSGVGAADSHLRASAADDECMQLEVHALCRGLEWHVPSAPRETSQLSRYCERVVPALLSAAARSEEAASSTGTSDRRRRRRGAAAAWAVDARCNVVELVRTAIEGCARAADGNALQTLLRLLTTEAVLVPLLKLPNAELNLELELASSLGTLLGGDHPLPGSLRRASAHCMAPVLLPFIARLGTCPETSTLATALLVALGRLPPVSAPAGRRESTALALPTELQTCAHELFHWGARWEGTSFGGSASASEEPPLVHIEWFLLHLQHAQAVDTCLEALGAFCCSAFQVELLPPPTLRRLVTIWAQLQQESEPAADVMDTDDPNCGGTATASTTGSGSKVAAAAGAAHALAHALARLPAEHSVGLPPYALRWLCLTLHAVDAEAATSLVVRLAVTVPAWMPSAESREHACISREHASNEEMHGAGASGHGDGGTGGAGGGGDAGDLGKVVRSGRASTLIQACRGDARAASVLVQLLSSHVHQAQQVSGGLCATLHLVHACLIWAPATLQNSGGGQSSGDGKGASSSTSAASAHATLAAAGLASALAQLCMLLPIVSEDNSASHALRLVLRLLTALMRTSAATGRVDLAVEGRAKSTAKSHGIESLATAEALAATHHAIAALMRDAKAFGWDGAARFSDGGKASSPPVAGARLEMLNFLNVVVALHAETVFTLAANLPFISTLARLATHGPAAVAPETSAAANVCAGAAAVGSSAAGSQARADAADGCGGADEPSAAAASLLLVQLLRRLGAYAPADATLALRRALLNTLADVLGELSQLLPAMRSRLEVRCAAALQLTAELCDVFVLRAAGDAWLSELPVVLLNVAVRTEPSCMHALCRLCTSLARPSALPAVRAAFELLATHPWQLFVFEAAVQLQRRLPAPLCGYLALVLETAPCWTHGLACRKPELVREAVALLLHAMPFRPEQLALLQALGSLSLLNPKLTAEAQRLIAFRLREPSAARWHREAEDDVECLSAAGGASDADVDGAADGAPPPKDAFVSIDGVVVPGAVLRAADPVPKGGEDLMPSRDEEMEMEGDGDGDRDRGTRRWSCCAALSARCGSGRLGKRVKRERGAPAACSTGRVEGERRGGTAACSTGRGEGGRLRDARGPTRSRGHDSWRLG